MNRSLIVCVGVGIALFTNLEGAQARSLKKTPKPPTLNCTGTLTNSQGSAATPYQVNVKVVTSTTNFLHEGSIVSLSPIESGFDAGQSLNSTFSGNTIHLCEMQSCPPDLSPCTCVEPVATTYTFPKLSLGGKFLGEGPFSGDFRIQLDRVNGTVMGTIYTKVEYYSLRCTE